MAGDRSVLTIDQDGTLRWVPVLPGGGAAGDVLTLGEAGALMWAAPGVGGGPAPVAREVAALTATSAYDGFPVSNLIDTNPATVWVPATGAPFPVTLDFTLSAPAVVDTFELTAADTQGSFSGRQVGSLTLFGSHDGASWDQLGGFPNLGGSWVIGEARKFAVPNTGAYARYRVRLDSHTGEVYTGFQTMRLLGPAA